MFLSEALDARLLLFLHQLPVRQSIADQLLNAVAQLPEDNLLYLNDVFRAWRRHAQVHDPTVTIGVIRWQWAQKKIATYPKITLPYVDQVHTRRLLRILRNFAEKCTFNRLGDTFIQDALFIEFPPEIFAEVADSEPPYARAGPFFGNPFNDTVQALVRTTPNNRLVATEWRSTRHATDFAFIASLGIEMLGQTNLPKLLKNHEICYEKHAQSALPQLIVLESVPGMLWSGSIFFASAEAEFSLISLFFQWVRCSALCGDTCCRSLQCAVETPMLLSARDPIHCLL